MNELYQTQILALARHARQGFSVSSPTHFAKLKNPLCGDEVYLELAVKDDVIIEVGAKVQGCALCEAGTGLFLQLALNEKTNFLEALYQEVGHYLSGDDGLADKYQAFTPIRDVKNRHKCVMLAFTASTHLQPL